jgi:hypothetical protein
MEKYEKWYQQITSRGSKTKSEGLERHHILPRSLGGTNDKANITFITPREHFVCHWLLIKIYRTGEEHWKMLNALRMMRAENPNQKRYSTKITSRVYAKLKEEYTKLQSEKYKGSGNGFYGKRHTDEAKQRISEANKGRVQPPEEKDRQKSAMIGKRRAPFSQEWKDKLSEAGSGEKNSMFGKTHKETTKQLMREKALGRKQSTETIQKKADAIRGTKREKKFCPHCQQQVAVNGYARWHGPRCRTLVN